MTTKGFQTMGRASQGEGASCLYQGNIYFEQNMGANQIYFFLVGALFT
jgi:hypothetical protein